MELDDWNWRQAFREADSLPQTATSAEKANRGRQLEKILSAMFKESRLQPRLSYRPSGEEIDGSIWLDGRTVLIEAKWTAKSHPASSLYQFKGKVDGKLSGTIGVFISIGGFSTDAVDALVAGKELNILLADGDDIRAVVDDRMSITDALHLKLRAAGDNGTPFLPLAASPGPTSSHSRRHLVFVEGRSDVRYLEWVRRTLGASSAVQFVPAAGPSNIAPLVRSTLELIDKVDEITVIVDGDLEGEFVDRLRQDLGPLTSERGISFEVLAVTPDLEVALGLTHPSLSFVERKHLRNISDNQLNSLVSSSDLLNRAASNPSLGPVLRAIGVATSANLTSALSVSG